MLVLDYYDDLVDEEKLDKMLEILLEVDEDEDEGIMGDEQGIKMLDEDEVQVILEV